ncbi:MAG: class I SAM-dependent methyltransferase [Pseudonocardiales bacterium]|nr:MAG: class I SAM-dependent methyltransferase [Pseudonocardiales bacterium]
MSRWGPGHRDVVQADLHEHYTNRFDEATRLDSTLKGRLERARVRDVMARYLPAPPADVVDVGGGPGAHAAWLQSRGYTVELLDPVQSHVGQAREAGIPAVLGDARSLPWPDGRFAAALLAGPLYHLIDAGDRRQALREAVRVLRPGGLVAVVAINRFANLLGATLANQLGERRRIVEEILADGFSPRNDRMAHTYYHTVNELHAELTGAGMRSVTVHGLTGPGGWLTVAIDRHVQTDVLPSTLADADPLQTALDGARIADRYPDLAPASALLMAVGYRD